MRGGEELRTLAHGIYPPVLRDNGLVDALRALAMRAPIRIDVDDGVGMDPARRDAGDGLIGMRDRIGAVGGTLDINAAPGRGTIVRGTIPAAEAS